MPIVATRSETGRGVRRRAGLTLIEIVASTFLVGALLVGSLAAVGGIFRTWSAVESRQEAAALTEMLLAEILSQYYEEPVDTPAFGPESGESAGNRLAWDDVDDYHGWKAAPCRRDGSALVDSSGWSWDVQVAFVQVRDPTKAIATDAGLKRITVRTTEPSGRVTALIAFRSRWGALETQPDVSLTIHAGVAATLELESRAPLHGGARLFNHARDN